MKEVAYMIEVFEGELNQLKFRAYTQAKLLNELINFLGNENEFKEHLKKTYIPEKMKKQKEDAEKQNTTESK